MGLEPELVVGGRYRLTQPLDRGGMGTVWAARDESGNALAIKFLNHAFSTRALRRFRREAQALERLDHPNVVRIIAHGFEDSCPFIAMELLQGQTLRGLLATSGALPPGQVLRLLSDAGKGLNAAHALGIVHRDVKPSNLFLCRTDDGLVVTKLIDFGIATGDPFERDSQSGTTGMIGSPAYMSPEQARGENVDQSADVWSLAVVAFQMLTGHEPFGGANVPETLQRICAGHAPRASALASGLPEGSNELFTRAFAPKRRDRFQTIDELLSALHAICSKAPDVAAVSAVPARNVGRSETTASYAGAPPFKRQTSKVMQRAPLVGFGLLALSSLLGAFYSRAREEKRVPEESTKKTVLEPVAPLVVTGNAAPVSSALPPAPATSTTASTASSASSESKRANVRRFASGQREARPPATPSPRSRSEAVAPTSSAIAVGFDPVFGLRVSQPDAYAHANDSASVVDGLDVHDGAAARRSSDQR